MRRYRGVQSAAEGRRCCLTMASGEHGPPSIVHGNYQALARLSTRGTPRSTRALSKPRYCHPRAEPDRGAPNLRLCTPLCNRALQKLQRLQIVVENQRRTRVSGRSGGV